MYGCVCSESRDPEMHSLRHTLTFSTTYTRFSVVTGAAPAASRGSEGVEIIDATDDEDVV